jgi:DNA-binding transcriptional MerR regulator
MASERSMTSLPGNGEGETVGHALMTIGDLSRRSGMSVRKIRRYTDFGLIYSRGRSPANYRLYDESAFWCIETIRTLRRLGLTVKEIRILAEQYLNRPQEPIGPYLDALLSQVRGRLDQRINTLQRARSELDAFRRRHELAGRGDLAASDPTRT